MWSILTTSDCPPLARIRLNYRVQVGLKGYVYKKSGCDGGSGDRVGCSNRKWLALDLRPGGGP